MKNEIENLENEIEELEEKKSSGYSIISINKRLEKLEKTTVEWLKKIFDKKDIEEIKVSNQPEFPKEIRVSNQKEFPKEIRISNQKEFPGQITVKNDTWIKPKDINPILAKLIEIGVALSKIKLTLPDRFKIDFSEAQTKKGKIYVTPINERGDMIAGVGGGNAGGGGNYDEDGNLKVNVVVGDITVDSSITLTSYAVTLVVADTEYSQALPAGTRGFQIQARTDVDIRYALVAGKVATPTDPYHTAKSGNTEWQEGLYLTGYTIYLASATAGTVVEILVKS